MSNIKKTTSAPEPITPISGRGVSIKPGFNETKKKSPDYDYWKKMPYWSLVEGTYLICDQEPLPTHPLNHKSNDSFVQKIKKVYELVKRAHQILELEYDSYSPPGGVIPIKFVKWALEVDIEVPSELKSFATVDEKEKIDGISGEDFIRALRVSYENDNEIKIQRPGTKAKTCLADHFGKKSWKALINLLQFPPHKFYAGASQIIDDGTRIKNPDYGKKQKLLISINKKLIQFINNNFNINIPINYKLFELDKTEKKGTYKYKFLTGREIQASNGLQSKYDKWTKDKLLDLLSEISDTYRRTPEDHLLNDIEEIRRVLTEKHHMTEDEIKKHIL